jgi:hypothetical protein
MPGGVHKPANEKERTLERSGWPGGPHVDTGGMKEWAGTERDLLGGPRSGEERAGRILDMGPDAIFYFSFVFIFFFLFDSFSFHLNH